MRTLAVVNMKGGVGTVLGAKAPCSPPTVPCSAPMARGPSAS
jgi:hypothetical protein